jgi:hypothetical protein
MLNVVINYETVQNKIQISDKLQKFIRNLFYINFYILKF